MYELEENLSVVYDFICAIAILLAIYLGAALSILHDTVRKSIRVLLGRASQPHPDELSTPSTGPSASIQETGTTR